MEILIDLALAIQTVRKVTDVYTFPVVVVNMQERRAPKCFATTLTSYIFEAFQVSLTQSKMCSIPFALSLIQICRRRRYYIETG